jgi:hypothetical protein
MVIFYEDFVKKVGEGFHLWREIMNHQQRKSFYNRQNRGFYEGTVESINQQWIFFEHESDEAFSLDEYIDQEIEVYREKQWCRGLLREDGNVMLKRGLHYLQNEEQVKIRKPLNFSFEKLLEELSDDSFLQFITVLNSLEFSIYDCVYSYNQLLFSEHTDAKSGVNFLFFDNGEVICAVQHHFLYSESKHDRFEFTMNTGKRIIIEKMNSKQK